VVFDSVREIFVGEAVANNLDFFGIISLGAVLRNQTPIVKDQQG
jgi:hypothetical protein